MRKEWEEVGKPMKLKAFMRLVTWTKTSQGILHKGLDFENEEIGGLMEGRTNILAWIIA